MFWSDKKVERLKQLWDERLSASRCADALCREFPGEGITRSSVIGKIHRLGMGGTHPAPGSKSMKRIKAQPTRSIPRRKPSPGPRLDALPIPDVMPGDIARKSLQEREDGECKWPVGDPMRKDFGFCALEAVPGSPYCVGHSRRAFQNFEVKLRVVSEAKTRETEMA